jgi:hypothetical protein
MRLIFGPAISKDVVSGLIKICVGIRKKIDLWILNFRIIIVERHGAENWNITVEFWGTVCWFVGVPDWLVAV